MPPYMYGAAGRSELNQVRKLYVRQVGITGKLNEATTRLNNCLGELVLVLHYQDLIGQREEMLRREVQLPKEKEDSKEKNFSYKHPEEGKQNISVEEEKVLEKEGGHLTTEQEKE